MRTDVEEGGVGAAAEFVALDGIALEETVGQVIVALLTGVVVHAPRAVLHRLLDVVLRLDGSAVRHPGRRFAHVYDPQFIDEIPRHHRKRRRNIAHIQRQPCGRARVGGRETLVLFGVDDERGQHNGIRDRRSGGLSG